MSEIGDTLTTMAVQAIDDGNWPLAAALCTVMGELGLAEAVRAGAKAAWDAHTVAVPLLKVPTREEVASAFPMWACDRTDVHEGHIWRERSSQGHERAYTCPGRTVEL